MTLSQESPAPRRRGARALALLALAGLAAPGCVVTGVPAKRLPKELLGTTRADTIALDMVRLRMDPPDKYLVDARDILGVYIEGVLGGGEGKDRQPPPVNFPERGGLPPSVGYPIVVGDDGTVSLPQIPRITVKGRTVAEIEELVRREYTIKRKILKEGEERIIVTLMRRRNYQIVVVREDSVGVNASAGSQNGTQGQTQAGSTLLGSNRKGAVFTLDLPAYENDVAHALAQSGGLPGLDAKNEIQVRRGSFKSGEDRDALISRMMLDAKENGDKCCPQPAVLPPDPNLTTIPLRYKPGKTVRFAQDDIILDNGDVVFIPANPSDFFYTGGLLGGGQFPLPRDVDLDVLGAIALARGPIGSTSNPSAGGGSSGLSGIIPATEIIVVRTTKCGQQVPIKVDLKKALTNKKERLLIQPGDVVMLQFTPGERIGNAFLGTFNFNLLLNRGFGQ